ncbi:MAG: YicC family protein [Cytophagia bacterium]|nr:YicC family protein [Cytophagia bacterium]
MIKSMTGFGYSSISKKKYSIDIEIKTLNSKYFDLNYKCNEDLGKVETDIRSISKKILERGKIDININIKFLPNKNEKIFNNEKFNIIYSEIKKLSNKSIEVEDKVIFNNALKNIDLITYDKNINISEKIIISQLKKGLNSCLKFRKDEGKSIYKDINKFIRFIRNELNKVQKLDKNRKKKKVSSLRQKISDIKKVKFDKNRFEQELFYYIEKVDINEELVRLDKHIDLLTKTVKSSKSVGKKLNFISQEIGREINTIGSKCSDFKIQKSVINMKEYLEKIKENCFNIF